MSEVGLRIRTIRKTKKLSGVVVARKLGITPQYYYDIERGTRNLSAKFAIMLADYFKVSVDDLLGRTDEALVSSISTIKEALSEDVDLSEFFDELIKRDDLQILLKQVKPLKEDTIKRIIRYIKMVEDEESKE